MEIKSTQGGNFTPIPTLYPYSGMYQCWHVALCAGRNESCQISTRLTREVSEPQVAENCYLPLTGGIALTMYSLTCYTVMAILSSVSASPGPVWFNIASVNRFGLRICFRTGLGPHVAFVLLNLSFILCKPHFTSATKKEVIDVTASMG